MRVFFDHQVTSLQDAGGVSRYFYELARMLPQAGDVRPHLLLGFGTPALPFRASAPPARVLSWPAARLSPGYARYAVNEALTAAIAPARGRYEVYHATYQRALPWIRRRVLVATHHDSTPDRFPGLFRDSAAIHARLEKLYAAADRILCISEHSRRDLLEFYRVDAGKTEVIHQGFTPLACVDGGGEVRTWNLKEFRDRPFLLYVGSRPAYKNFAVVLEALARQKHDAAWLLAMGGGAFTAEEGQLIDRMRLQSRVRLVPRATEGELAAAYAAAHLFVYPSLYEGFGFPPLEAMAAGCPALVSRAAALPEICGEAAFYFDPLQVEDLTNLIDRLLEDGQLRLSKEAAGRRQVLKYSWSKTAAATLAAYQKALESR